MQECILSGSLNGRMFGGCQRCAFWLTDHVCWEEVEDEYFQRATQIERETSSDFPRNFVNVKHSTPIQNTYTVDFPSKSSDFTSIAELEHKTPKLFQTEKLRVQQVHFQLFVQYHPPHHDQIIMKNTTKQQLTKHDHPEWPRANLSNTQPKSQLSSAVCGLGFWPRRALGRLEAWVEGGERVWHGCGLSGVSRWEMWDVRWGNVRNALWAFFLRNFILSLKILTWPHPYAWYPDTCRRLPYQRAC